MRAGLGSRGDTEFAEKNNLNTKETKEVLNTKYEIGKLKKVGGGEIWSNHAEPRSTRRRS